MFDTVKFGKALSTLRKEADMTQNEVADKLNLSRQAISKYERGETFPDISVLVMIAELFNVTLDELINFGEPTKGESSILKNVANGNADVVAENISDVVLMIATDYQTCLKNTQPLLVEKLIILALKV